MDGLSGRARDTGAIKDARLKFTSHMAYTLRRGRVILGVSILVPAPAWNFCRRFIKSANSAEPLCCRCSGYIFRHYRSACSMFSKGTSNLGKSLGKKSAIRERRIIFFRAGEHLLTDSSVIPFSQCQNGRDVSIFNEKRSLFSIDFRFYINKRRER